MATKSKFLLLSLLAVSSPGQWYFSYQGDTQNYDHRPESQPNTYGRWLLNTMVWTTPTFVVPPVYMSQSGDFTAHATLEEFRANFATFMLSGVRWGACMGNHDYLNGRKAGGLEPWGQIMGAQRRVDEVQTPEGIVAFMHLAWCPDDEDADLLFNYASVNPSTPIIVNTHSWLTRPAGYKMNTRLPPGIALRERVEFCYGTQGDMAAEKFWDKVIDLTPSVFMVTCGHVCNQGRRTDVSRFGTEVGQHLFNMQCEPWGGNGFQRVFAFFGRTQFVYDFSSAYHIQRYGVDWTFLDVIQLRESVSELRARLAAQPIWRTRNSIDTYVYSLNGGGGTRCADPEVIIATGGEWQQVGLLRFDLTGAHTPQQAAVMQLSFEVYQGDSVQGFSVHRMLRDWGVCPSWLQLGGLRPGIDYEVVPLYSETETSLGIVNIDVTNQVREWVTGRQPNYGFAFIGGGTDPAKFYSSEHWANADRPLLIVR